MSRGPVARDHTNQFLGVFAIWESPRGISVLLDSMVVEAGSVSATMVTIAQEVVQSETRTTYYAVEYCTLTGGG